MTVDGVTLAFDVGTTTVKAGLYNLSGQPIGYRIQPLALSLPKPGWAEQDPDEWWRAMATVSRSLFSEFDLTPNTLRAIGVTAQMSGLVVVDSHGRPLRKALVLARYPLRRDFEADNGRVSRNKRLRARTPDALVVANQRGAGSRGQGSPLEDSLGA